MKIGLLASAKAKHAQTRYAKDMYTKSSLFSAAYQYAAPTYDRLYILSSAHYLLHPDEVIDPYEGTMRDMPAKERKDWANEVFIRMKERIPMHKVSTIYIHAGRYYSQYLIPLLEKEGYQCIQPTKGMNVGQQMEWYRKNTSL